MLPGLDVDNVFQYLRHAKRDITVACMCRCPADSVQKAYCNAHSLEKSSSSRTQWAGVSGCREYGAVLRLVFWRKYPGSTLLETKNQENWSHPPRAPRAWIYHRRGV